MAFIADDIRIYIFDLDKLQKINVIGSKDSKIHKSYGIQLIQRKNVMMEFHVEQSENSD